MKKLILFLLITIGFQSIKAQNKILNFFTPKVNISFDSSGKMIQFPRAVVRYNNIINFNLLLSPGYLDSEIHVFQQLLSGTDDFLKNLPNFQDTILEEGIQKIRARTSYDCFLRGYEDTYQSNIEKYISILNDSYCKNQSEFKSLIQNEDLFIPIKEYLNNVLNKQFEIRVYNGSTLVKSFYLTGNCADNCISFTREGEKIKNLICTTCNYGKADELQFQLIQHNPLNTTLTEWYNNQVKMLIKRLETQNISTDTVISNLRMLVSGASCNMVTTYFGKTQVLDQWFNSWLWFTQGKLTLDPLSNINKTKQDELKLKIVDLKTYSTKLKELKIFIDSVKVHLAPKIKNIDVFEKISTKNRDLSDKILDAKKQQDALQQELDDGTALKKEVMSTYNLLYTGKLAISRPGKIKVQKQFDIASDYKAIFKNKRELERITEIPENENIKIVFHNVDSSKNYVLDQKRLDFNDIPDITKFVNEQLSNSGLSSITAAQLTNFNDFFKSFAVQPVQSPIDALSKKQSDSLKFNQCWCMFGIITYLKPLLEDLDNNKLTFPPNQLFKTPKNSILDKALYRTELKAAGLGFEAPYRDSINFRQFTNTGKDTFNVGKTYIKVGKLRHFQLAAGLAFTYSPVSTTTIDTTGNGFKVSSSDNRAAAIVGVKIYPFKNYNRDNSIIPRYPLRRISVFGGFELLHPLNNFFVGGSYDIVPGLAVSYGGNIYLQTQYKVQNSVITNTARSYKWNGGYFSVMVDPTLFVQFVKLFFK